MEETSDVIERFRPIFGDEKTDRLLLVYNGLSEERRKRWSFLWRAKHLNPFGFLPEDSRYVFLNPPAREVSAGEYPLGITKYGKHAYGDFGLRRDELIQHTLVVGRSGAGKTNTMLNLVGRFLQKGDPALPDGAEIPA